MIHITEEQVRQALPMTKAIELVEEGFRRLDRARAVNHPRRRVSLDTGTMLHYMTAGDQQSGYLGAKIYTTNRQTGAHFVVLLFEPDGVPAAMIDANALGQIRTGAATGVATKHLAREDACTVGMIGTGFQARAQLEAVAAVRSLSRVRVHSRSPESRERFAAEMGERLGLDIEAAQTAEQALRGCDIAVTITTAREPVLRGVWLPDGCHVNAAGSNHAKRRELDGDAVERASLVVVDSLEQARMEAGDLIYAAEEGRLDWTKVRELGAIVGGRLPGRTAGADVTLFESQGLAMEDLIAAEHVFREIRKAE